MNISTEFLYTKGISPNQYIILTLLWSKNYNELTRLLTLVDKKKELSELITKKYILKEDPITINNKLVRELLKIDGNFFWELFTSYPIHVNSNGGKRMLRPVSHESKKALEIQKKYNKEVTDISKHTHILKCLDIELKERRKSNSFAYMSALETYVNNCGWENYEYLLSDGIDNKDDLTLEQEI